MTTTCIIRLGGLRPVAAERAPENGYLTHPVLP